MDCYQLGESLHQRISCCDHVLFNISCIECRSINAFFGWDDHCHSRSDIFPTGEPSTKGLTNKNIPQTPNTLSQIIGKDVEKCVPSFRTVKGETVRFLTENNYAAILEDPSCLGAYFGPFPVHFAPHILEQMTSVECGRFLAHVIPVTGNDEFANDKVIYVGDIGLLGGGQTLSSSFTSNSHSCEDFVIYKCATCGYSCPNKKCVKCCSHQDHTCMEEKSEKEMETKYERRVSDQQQSTLQGFVQNVMDETDTEVDISEENDLETEDQLFVILDTQEMEKLNENGYESEKHSQPHQEVAKIGDLPYYHKHDNFSLAVKSPLIIPVWGEVLTKYLEKKNYCRLDYSRLKYIEEDNDQFTELREIEDEEALWTKILDSKATNKHVIEKFKFLKTKLENIYLEPQSRILILKQSLVHTREQSLTSLCDMLRVSLEMLDEDVLDLYKTTDFCFLKLKERWLKKKYTNIFHQDPEKNLEILSKVVFRLAHSFWSLEMCLIFQNHTQNERDVEGLLRFLDLVLDIGTPEAVVILVLKSDVTPDEKGSRIGAWTNLIMFQVLCNIIHFSHKVIDNIAPHLFELVQRSISPTVLMSFIRDHSKQIVENTRVFAQVCEIMHNYRVSNECCEKVLKHIGKFPITHWKSRTDRKIISYIFPSTDGVTTETLIQQLIQKSEFLRQEEGYENKLLSEYTNVMNYYNEQIRDFIKVSEVTKLEGLRRPIFSWDPKEIQQWAGLVKENKIEENIHLTIAILQRAMVLHMDLDHLNTVQVLALLILLQPKGGMGRLAQINTGEGKTIIIAILAAVHALRGKKVDVITSSRELAIKGAGDMRGFFNMLTLKVSHNTRGSVESNNLKDAYKCDVVYGTTLDFIGDTLRKEFLGDDDRCGRKFDRVIVDEFDSLLFDDHRCKIRLSQRMTAMNYLELVLGEIWHYLNFHGQRIIEEDGETYYIDDQFYLQGNKKILKSGSPSDKVLKIEEPRNHLINTAVKHIEKLIEKPSTKRLQTFEEYRELQQEVFKKGETLDEEEKKKNEEYQNLIKKLENHPCLTDPLNNYPVVQIPTHLRVFAEKQTPIWVQNAIHAATVYTKNAHYTVQDDKIVPISYDENGELQMNLVWSDGVAQYLQMKEGFPVDPENISTNFLSHVTFFKRFIPHIYGVSGTGGTQDTQDFLHKTFHVELAVIPPQKQRKILDNNNSLCLCKELVPIIVANEDEWYGYVAAHALHHAKLKRAVLVICRFVLNANKVIKLLQRTAKNDESLKIHAYTGVSTFKKRNLDCGDIVVATIIAGRGADFIPTPEVEKNGGLFVCTTFLPKSFRVGMQNTGRTGRQGRKGMAQYIIYDPQCSNIKDLIAKRDEQERESYEKAKENVKKIILEDELFNKFCALESSILPDASEIEKERKFKILQAGWDKIKDNVDLKEKLLRFRNHMKRKIREARTSLRGTNEEETEEEKVELQKMVKETRTECEKQLLEKYLHNHVGNYPSDVIQCLREGKEYVSAKSEEAAMNNWGPYERMALEERWGLWLKVNDCESEASLRTFNVDFAEPIRKDAKEKELIRNPFIYVLKGNDYLLRKKSSWLWHTQNDKCLEDAIECYDKAIKLDETFSAHARYYKACALLSHHWNINKQSDASVELDAALKVIKKTLQPNLSLFLASMSATNNLHEKTIQHIEHQLNIIEQLENSICKAKEVLMSSKLEKHVELSLVPIMKAFESYDKDHSAAIREEYTNGLTHLFCLELRPPVKWQNVALLSVIGCFQLIFGIGMLCFGQVAGVGLIVEGISDLILAVTSIFRGSFSWGKWMLFKGGNFFMSLLCAGARSIVTGLKYAVGVVRWVKNTVMGVEVASKGIGCAVQVIVSPENVNFLNEIESVTKNRKIYDNYENQIFSVIENELKKFVSKSDLLAKALDLDFIKGNEYWTQIFLEKISKLIMSSECQKEESELKTQITTEIKHCLDSGSVQNISKTLTTKLQLFIRKILTSFKEEITIYEDDISSLQRCGRSQEANSDLTAKEKARNANDNLSHGPRKVEFIPVCQQTKEKFTYKFCSVVTQRYCSQFRKIFRKFDDIPMSNFRKNMTTENKAKMEKLRQIYEEFAKNDVVLDSQTDDVTTNSSEHSNLSQTFPAESQIFDSFKKKAYAPIKMLHLLPPILNKSIVVVDSLTGRLIDFEGNKNAIDPILLKLDHTKMKNLIHHYLPVSDSQIVESEPQDSILNAVWAQLNSESKKELSLLTLKIEIVKNLIKEEYPNEFKK